MNGPSAATVKANAPSLVDYLLQLPSTLEAQMLYALLLAGTLGLMANYGVRWLRDEITGSLYTYLFKNYAKGTILSFSAFLGLAITSIQAGIFSTETGEFVGWATVMWFGLTQGFAVDAIANRGDRKVWTPQERALSTLTADQSEITQTPSGKGK